MISVLRKVAQLNIKYRKNGGPIIDVYTRTPSDKVTAREKTLSKSSSLRICL